MPRPYGDYGRVVNWRIENARNRAINNVKALGSDLIPMEQEARTLRFAIGLFEKTFDRLRKIYSSSACGSGLPVTRPAGIVINFSARSA